MFENNSSKIPIRFLMALSSNQGALNTFLKMENERQDEIIKQAQGIKNQRQMQSFVSDIGRLN